MRRPAAWIGFGYLITLAVARSFSAEWLIAGAVLLLICGLTLLVVGKAGAFRSPQKGTLSAVICTALTAATAMAVLAVYQTALLQPIAQTYGRTLSMRGRIVSEVTYTDSGVQFLVQVDELEDPALPVGFTAQFYGFTRDSYQPDDCIEGVMTFSDPKSLYSAARQGQMLARSIYAVMEEEEIAKVLSPEALSPTGWMIDIRQQLAEAIDRLLPASLEGLVTAITIGDETRLSDETSEAFRLTGTTHLLVLSGMHLTIIAAIILWICDRLRIHRRIGYGITIVALFGFTAFVGFPFSAQRAFWMLAVHLLCRIALREISPLESLGIACGLICLLHPYAALDMGLQLSVATTAGISLFTAPLTKAFTAKLPDGISLIGKATFGFLRKIAPAFSASIAASAAALPIAMLSFSEVSLIGSVVTVCTAWLVPVIMGTGLLSGIFGWIGIEWLSLPIGWICGLFTGILRCIVSAFASIPMICVYLGHPYIAVCLYGTAIGALILHKLQARTFYKRIFLFVSASILVGCTILHSALMRDVLTISVANDTGIAVLSQNGGAAAVGTVEDSGELSMLRRLTLADKLQSAIFLQCDDTITKAFPEAFPDADCVDASSKEGCITLGKGTVTIFSDGALRGAAYEDNGRTVLLLPDGFDAQSVPAGYTHPSLLLTFGTLLNLELLRPNAVLILGENDNYVRRLYFTACGTQILNGNDPPERIYYRIDTRFGSDWKLQQVTL